MWVLGVIVSSASIRMVDTVTKRSSELRYKSVPEYIMDRVCLEVSDGASEANLGRDRATFICHEGIHGLLAKVKLLGTNPGHLGELLRGSFEELVEVMRRMGVRNHLALQEVGQRQELNGVHRLERVVGQERVASSNLRRQQVVEADGFFR
jgi:hypothetical protein